MAGAPYQFGFPVGCTNDATYIDNGWRCADWAGYDCGDYSSWHGSRKALLIFSCSVACTDITPVSSKQSFKCSSPHTAHCLTIHMDRRISPLVYVSLVSAVLRRQPCDSFWGAPPCCGRAAFAASSVAAAAHARMLGRPDLLLCRAILLNVDRIPLRILHCRMVCV